MIYAILIFTNLSCIIFLIALIKKHLLLLEKFDELNEKVEESLDVIEESYKKMSQLLQTPVLFDDPIVIELVDSAKRARSALLSIANKIAVSDDENKQ